MPEHYEITCPHCAKVYELPREKIARHAGSKIQCKTCTGVFLMPALPALTGESEPRRESAKREPALAMTGAAAGVSGAGVSGADADDASSSTQTPWPFAFAADDDDDADDVQDVEIEPVDKRDASSSDSHFADANLSDTFDGSESMVDETIDVEHEPTRGKRTAKPRTESKTEPRPQPVTDRINAVAGKLPVAAPFQREEIAANKIEAEKKATPPRIERPAKKKRRKPVSREVVPAVAVPDQPAIDPATLAALQGDLRSIRRWVSFAGWTVVLTVLTAATLVVLTYFGVVDWNKAAALWNAGG